MANAKSNDYEKELQKAYEHYRRDEISVNDIPPGMLPEILRMLKEERQEAKRFLKELDRFLRNADDTTDNINMSLFDE